MSGPRFSSVMEEVIRQRCDDQTLQGPDSQFEDDVVESNGPYEWRNAMLAVARVMAMWEQDVHRSADAWAKQLGEQVERSSTNTARWEEMHGQLGQIGQRLTEIERKVQLQSASSNSTEQRQTQLHARTVEHLEKTAMDLHEAIQQVSNQMHDRIARTDESICSMSHTIHEAHRAAVLHSDEALQSATNRLSEAVSEQGKVIGDAMVSSSEAVRQHVSALLLEDVHRATARSDEALRSATSRLTEAFSEHGHALGNAVASTAESVRQHVSGLLLEACSATDAAVGHDSRTVHAALRSVQAQLRELHDAAREGHARWSDEVALWRGEKERAELAAERACGETREALQRVAELEAEVTKLASQLQEDVEPRADEPVGAPAAVLFKRVKDIERRGAVRFNRQSGTLQVLKGTLDFAACKPSAQPTISFRDSEAAAQALGDIAELWKLFEGVLDVQSVSKPGKGGKPDFWERVASIQATHLKQELTRLGIPEPMIICKGSVAVQGLDPGVRLTFKRDVFSDESELAAPKPIQTPRR